MEVKVYQLLRSKKTGLIHCPVCLAVLRDIKLCLECKGCKLYFSKEGVKDERD